MPEGVQHQDYLENFAWQVKSPSQNRSSCLLRLTRLYHWL